MTSELAGVPEADVLATEDPARLDPMREAVFAFARTLTLDPASVRRADVDRLRPHLTDAQIVELALAVCRYNTMNRLADAFGVPLERENVFAPAQEDEAEDADVSEKDEPQDVDVSGVEEPKGAADAPAPRTGNAMVAE